MVEPASDTSDFQRFDEMFLHLTPRGAVVPYNACFDSQNNIWVATKGGLFKFDGEKRTTLWERKNLVSKKMSPFPQVECFKDTIIYSCCEDKEKTTEFRYFDLEGNMKHEQFIDGIVISLSVADNGDMYITKQARGKDDSVILKSSFDAPLGWDTVLTSDTEAFQTLCVLDDCHLVAAMADRPVTMASKQRMVLINTEREEIVKSFSSEGKEGEKIFFPRSIKKYGDDFVLMDKAGRFLKFDRTGKFLDLLAQIDAFLGNGFCIKDGRALMALSGIVYDEEKRTICDDWLEWISLDGTSWKKQREAN